MWKFIRSKGSTPTSNVRRDTNNNSSLTTDRSSSSSSTLTTISSSSVFPSVLPTITNQDDNKAINNNVSSRNNNSNSNGSIPNILSPQNMLHHPIDHSSSSSSSTAVSGSTDKRKITSSTHSRIPNPDPSSSTIAPSSTLVSEIPSSHDTVLINGSSGKPKGSTNNKTVTKQEEEEKGILPTKISRHGHYPSQSIGGGLFHTRRLSEISRVVIDDHIPPPPPLGSSSNSSADLHTFSTDNVPPFLHGHVRELWILKRECAVRVNWIINSNTAPIPYNVSAAPNSNTVTKKKEEIKESSSSSSSSIFSSSSQGLIDTYGFQPGSQGAAYAAMEVLVSDLSSNTSAIVPTVDEAIQNLHESVFENYNLWCNMVNGKRVHSNRYGPSLYMEKRSLQQQQRQQSPVTNPNSSSTSTVPNTTPIHATTVINHFQSELPTIGEISSSTTPSTRSTISRASSVTDSSIGSNTSPPKLPTDTTDHIIKSNIHPQSSASSSITGTSSPDNVSSSTPSTVTTDSLPKPNLISSSVTATPLMVESSTVLPDGSDSHTKLYELCLYYCIRSEAANLRFMPEVLCWLFHQMRYKVRSPTNEAIQEHCTDQESSFFHRTTVIPLYEILKRHSKKSLPVDTSLWVSLVCFGCRKRGKDRLLRNSQRPNYDDMNELFWLPECLTWGYHSLDEQGAMYAPMVSGLRKSFREKASWASIFLSFWRWWAFQAILFHALFIIAWDIVAAGGINITGIVNVDIVSTLIHATGCFETLGYTHLLLCTTAMAHGLPFGSKHFWHDTGKLCTVRNIVKGIYAIVWTGIFVVVANSKLLLGTDLAGGFIWLAIIGVKLFCIAIAEGLFSVCGCTRRSIIRNFFIDMEHVYLTNPDFQTRALSKNVSPPTSSSSSPSFLQRSLTTVLGNEHMQEPLSRVLTYTLFWLIVLLAKVVFDLHVITQQVRLVRTLQESSLVYLAPFNMEIIGFRNGLIVIGSWITIIALVMVDSYIAFILVAPILGYYVCKHDGLGLFMKGSNNEVKLSFIRGLPTNPTASRWNLHTAALPSTSTSTSTSSSLSTTFGSLLRSKGVPLADQFIYKCIPFARQQGIDSNSIFRRIWDQFILSLREIDLISNEEQCRLMYGDGVLGIENQLPLFMYAGKIKQFVKRANKIVSSAQSSVTDEEFLRTIFTDDGVTEEAVTEIIRALPPILTLICQSHSSIGYGDRYIASTIYSLFTPLVGQNLRDSVTQLLLVDNNPVHTIREVTSLIVQLMVKFEHDNASTRLRRSPVLVLTVQLLIKLYSLWHPDDKIVSSTTGSSDTVVAKPKPKGGAVTRTMNGTPSSLLSFTAPTLDAIAQAALLTNDSSIGSNVTHIPSSVQPPPDDKSSSFVSDGSVRSTVLFDTRSIRGIIKLLEAPNEGSGRLDADHDPDTVERLEALRESARRVYYLITMETADGSLLVPEAERRLTWFINSLYMHQMPVSASVLYMPSFTVVTPHYNEAVIYGKLDFLTVVNSAGISPMVYLKSLHHHEWLNFCERLGVDNESDAWKASTDALGIPCSGEMETRLFASYRGQTLARTVHGMMQYARAIRLLSTIQLELEYADLVSKQQLSLSVNEIEEHAAQAALWFTAERFSYIVASQRYYEHHEDDVRRRADIDYLLLIHPLLQIAYFESSMSPYTGRRRLMSVIKNSNLNIKFRIPAPGNPIMDGIGEGKPENQQNTAPYVLGRYVQAIDMNQDGYFEEALKIPNALLCLGGGSTEYTDHYHENKVTNTALPSRSTIDPVYHRSPTKSGRPIVVLGLREHIFTLGLSAPAFFMAQQEYLFGTMWQRIMSSPLRVRFHYGHPDLFDKVWTMTRGGTAKASSVINVSEDIFAGYNAMLRGGESNHIEFLQIGKGRDVGMLQIETFESKISGGTAISMTSRDSFRVAEGMDFSRLLSFFHTGGGFYISNVLVVVSLVTTVYYMASMSLTGADYAVLASEYVYLVGDITIFQWFVQLGFLSIIPLYALYALESGFILATLRTLRMFAMLSPLFFIFEIQTKAYYFDAGLCFGRQSYLGTGRDFVLRHITFDENFRATAHSHLYLGAEVLLLLTLTTLYGAFESIKVYVFFFLTGWLFGISLFFSPLWFNPLTMDWRSIREDWKMWTKWINNEKGSTPEESWKVWYTKECEQQYAQANLTARIIRVLRISRLLFPASILIFRLKPNPAYQLLTLLLFIGGPFVTMILIQSIFSFTSLCGKLTKLSTQGSTEGTNGNHSGLTSTLFIVNRILLATIGGGICFGILLFGSLGWYKFTLNGIIEGGLSYLLILFWLSRVLNISSVWVLADSIRIVHKFFDILLGITLLFIQTLFATLCPLGATLHTRMLFSSSNYGDTVDIITGSRDTLNRMNKNTGIKYLKLKYLGQLEFQVPHHQPQSSNVSSSIVSSPSGSNDGTKNKGGKGTKKEGDSKRPENRIGVRQFRLKKIQHPLALTDSPNDNSNSTIHIIPLVNDSMVVPGTGTPSIGGSTTTPNSVFSSSPADDGPRRIRKNFREILASTVTTATTTTGSKLTSTHPRSSVVVTKKSSSGLFPNNNSGNNSVITKITINSAKEKSKKLFKNSKQEEKDHRYIDEEDGEDDTKSIADSVTSTGSRNSVKQLRKKFEARRHRNNDGLRI